MTAEIRDDSHAGKMLLDSLAVIFVRTRFPENIGMAARACANMGCPAMLLVRPERWDPLKAEPMATGQGMKIIRSIRIFPDLPAALAPFTTAYAATARLGGWRRRVKSPQAAAEEIAARLRQGERIALVFGSEDRGLENRELASCQEIVSIPVEADARSLNLAQAALILLYECRKACAGKAGAGGGERDFLTCAEKGLLEESLKAALVKLNCFTETNQDYFFQQWRELLHRAGLRRHDYAALMGLCRQIMNRVK